MKFVNLHFGKKLKEAIQLKGLTQADFSEKIGVSGTTVSRWLSGVCLPEDHRQDDIFQALGVDEHFFFNTNPTPSITSAQIAEIQKALSKSSNDKIGEKISILEQELKKRDQEIANLRAKIKRLGKREDYVDIDRDHPEFKKISESIQSELKKPGFGDATDFVEGLFPSDNQKTKKGAG